MQECGELRGEGWVQQESGGDMVGGKGEESPKWKRVPHRTLSSTHSQHHMTGKIHTHQLSGDDKSICQEPKDFCD